MSAVEAGVLFQCEGSKLHISFDFDYTLADSSQGAIICANHALKLLGQPERSAAEIKKTIGLNLEETYKQLTTCFKVEEVQKFSSLFLTKADEVVVQGIRFFESTKEVLAELKNDGHYLSIVSTKYTKRIDAALKRDELNYFINHVVGGDMVNESKPSPEGLELAIAHSGINRQSTIYVGDSKSDGLAAKAAGIGFVGVLTGVTTKQKLIEFDPIEVLDGLKGLTNVVQRLERGIKIDKAIASDQYKLGR